MCTEVSGISDEELFAYADWALETGIWDGHHVTAEDGDQLHDEVAERIITYLFSQSPDSFEFQKMSAHLAALGSENNPLLQKDIQDLHFTQDGMILQSGFGSSIAKFWQKHKTEILIGAAVVAIVTTAVVVTVCTAGTAAGPAAAAAGAGLGGLANIDNDPIPPPQFRKPEDNHLLAGSQDFPALHPTHDFNPPPLPSFHPQQEIYSPFNLPENPFPNIAPESHHLPALDLQQVQAYPEPPRFFSELTPQNIPPNIYENFRFPNDLSPSRPSEPLDIAPNEIEKSIPTLKDLLRPSISSTFETEGVKLSHCRIGGVNGIMNTLEDAKSNASYIAGKSNGMSVKWVHDQTHGFLKDVIEAACLMLGCKFPSEDLIREEWMDFHNQNIDNPNAKYLWISHSKGSLASKRVLADLPREVCDRMIIVNIAPAGAIPDEACFKSLNFASKSIDMVPYMEFVLHGALDTNEFRISDHMLDSSF